MDLWKDLPETCKKKRFAAGLCTNNCSELFHASCRRSFAKALTAGFIDALAIVLEENLPPSKLFESIPNLTQGCILQRPHVTHKIPMCPLCTHLKVYCVVAFEHRALRIKLSN